MVVKPLNFVARNARGLVQPALKCRGREYLRIIYGPEYDRAQNLERLRKRAGGPASLMELAQIKPFRTRSASLWKVNHERLQWAYDRFASMT